MNWRFSLFLLTMLALLVSFTWGTSDTGICSADYVKGVLADHTKDGALNCFDFWFNRYQTLIGAILALIAAWLATIPARGQLREMARQSAVSAREPMRDLALALEGEIELIQRASIVGARCLAMLTDYEEEDFDALFPQWNDNLWEHQRTLRNIISEVKILANRYSDTEIDGGVRNNLIDCLQLLYSRNITLSKSFRQQTAGLDHEGGEMDLTDDELLAAPRKVDEALVALRVVCKELENRLSFGIRRAWTEVRGLEAQATRP